MSPLHPRRNWRMPMRRYLPALTVLSFVSICDQGVAKGWEFDCKYPQYAQTLKGPPSTDFAIRFNFDDITNKAVMIGDNGVSDVSVYRGDVAITFLEFLLTGAVQTTTEVDAEGAIGRSQWDAPEIDGSVFLNGAVGLSPGDIVKAQVSNMDEYDLWAEAIAPGKPQ